MLLLQLNSFQGIKIIYCVDLGMLITFLGSPKRLCTMSLGKDGQRSEERLDKVRQFSLKSHIINCSHSKKN